MGDLFKHQREKAEQFLESTSGKHPDQESLEERKKRLRAHRDLLVQKNKEQR